MDNFNIKSPQYQKPPALQNSSHPSPLKASQVAREARDFRSKLEGRKKEKAGKELSKHEEISRGEKKLQPSPPTRRKDSQNQVSEKRNATEDKTPALSGGTSKENISKSQISSNFKGSIKEDLREKSKDRSKEVSQRGEGVRGTLIAQGGVTGGVKQVEGVTQSQGGEQVKSIEKLENMVDNMLVSQDMSKKGGEMRFHIKGDILPATELRVVPDNRGGVSLNFVTSSSEAEAVLTPYNLRKLGQDLERKTGRNFKVGRSKEGSHIQSGVETSRGR